MVDNQGGHPPPPPPPPAARKQRRRWPWIAAGVLVVIIVVAALAGGDEDEEPAASERTTTTAGATEATDASTTTEAPRTTTTAAPTTTETPTTTKPPLPGFGPGTQVVGTDTQPGRYVAGGELCYWERLSGLGGTFEEIITNGNPEGQAIVEILDSDVAFNSDGCGDWTLYVPPASPATSFGPGDWVVGEQIAPGTYRADAAGLCYWERASGFAHDFDEIITNGNPTGQAIVEIAPTDARFTTSGCGDWEPA
jgi:hypothetical protein